MTPKRLLLVLTLSALGGLGGCDYFVDANAGYEKARESIADGDRRRAVIELKNALQKDPQMHAARLLLADAALWLGDPTSAEKELAKIPADFDPSGRDDLNARIDLAMGRQQALLERLGGGEGALPAGRRAFYRGLALLDLRQAPAAEEQLRVAVQADPSLVEAQAALAEAMAAQNNMPGALEKSAELIKQHPDSALAWQVRGLLLSRQGENPDAAAALERAQTLASTQLPFGRQVALLAALTDAWLANRDLDKARAASDALGKLAPGSTIAVVTASRVSIAGNDYVTAASGLRSVVNSNPRLAQARFLLGAVLLAQGNLAQAGNELAVVVEQMPENVEARQLLAQVRMRQQDPDGAMRVIVPALQAGADDLRLNMLLDVARTQSGATNSIEMLERALQESPTNQSLQLQLAGSYLQAGQAAKALALLRKQTDGPPTTQRQAMLLQAVAQAQGNAAARSEVEKIVAANPSDANTLALAATFYVQIDDAESGRQLLAKGLQADPKSAALLLTSAQLEWSSRRPAEARAALQRLLEIDPKHSVARLSLAQAELAMGNVESATGHLETLRKDDSAAWAPRLILARLALARDDAKRADALVEEAIGASPADPELRGAAGMLYLDTGRYDRAIAHFHEGTKIDPENGAFWLNLGRAQQALGQEGLARQALEKALQLRPNWLAAEGALAFVDLQAGQRDAALNRIKRLQEQRPRDAGVLMLAGEVHAAVRDYAEAARMFEAATQVQPSAQLALKAYQARSAGKIAKPAEPIEQWVARNPKDLQARILLADAYTEMQNHRSAAEQYEQILAAQPAHVSSLNNLAWTYFELQDPRAKSVARKAYELAPKVPAIADTLGWILTETGQAQEAVGLLKNAAAADKNPEIRYHYAVALMRSGSRGEARSELDALLREHDTFPSRESAQRLFTDLSGGAATGS